MLPEEIRNKWIKIIWKTLKWSDVLFNEYVILGSLFLPDIKLTHLITSYQELVIF